MKDKESLSIRGEEDFGEFISTVLLAVGQILAMSGGGAFVLLFVLLFFDNLFQVPYKLLIIMVPVGVFGGSFLLVWGGMLKTLKRK